MKQEPGRQQPGISGLQAGEDVNTLAELRITITARCNPLWPTRQVIRVPFVMPRIDPDQP